MSSVISSGGTGPSFQRILTLNTSNGFNPLIVPGINLWLDAADSTSFSLSGSSVTQWNDKSGKGNHATQGTSSNQPTYANNAVTFSGAQNLLSAVSGSLSSETFFAILKPTSGDSTVLGSVAALNNTPSGNGGRSVLVIPSPSQIKLNKQFVAELAVGTFSSFNQRSLIGSLTDGANAFVYSNGTQAGTGAFPGYTSGLFTIIGRNGSGAVQYFTGEMNELIVYASALTTLQRQQVEGYLAWKWGIQNTLPTTHPYYNVNIYAQPQLLQNPTYSIPLLITQASWTPRNVSNLLLWFDAADTSTITGTTQVTSWTNKGTASATITNSSGSATSGNSGPYGQNYIDVPTTATFQFTVDLTSTGDRTWIFVVRNTVQIPPDPPAGPNIMTILGATVPQSDEFALARDSGTNYFLQQGPNGDAGGNYYVTNTTNPLNELNILVAVRSTTAANQIMTRNGNVLTNNTNNAAGNFATGSLNYIINVSGRPPFNLFEILFLPRAVPPGERQQLEGYLAWKWGVQGGLPLAHPFRNFPPAPN